MDYRDATDHSLAAGVLEQLHTWWVDPHTAGDGGYHHHRAPYSGTTSIMRRGDRKNGLPDRNNLLS